MTSEALFSSSFAPSGAELWRERMEAAFGAWGYAVNCTEIGCFSREHWAVHEGGGRLWFLGHHPHDPLFSVLLLVFDAESGPEDLARWQKAWSARLQRRSARFRGIQVVARVGGREAWISCPFERGDRSPGVRQVLWRPQESREVHKERLRRLELLDRDLCGWALTERLRDELDLRRVSTAFFRDIHKVCAGIRGSFEGSGLSQDRAQEAALTLLSRLLFLYFLQDRGLLDGRRDFVRFELRLAMREDRGVWRGFLEPLFFGVLRCPLADRSSEVLRFGEVPYLNGGLFERSSWEGPDGHAPSDALFVEVIEGFLERYAFTTREGGDDAGLDPEMLGRVFESLMSPQSRGRSGTFYTPKEVVETLSRRSLEQVLRARGVPVGVVEALLEEGRGVPMSPEGAREVLEVLSHVKILDLACGSGALLMGVLVVLERVHKRLQRIGMLPREKASHLRRRIIANSLHGVDLNGSALRLCTLRLWLSILDVTGVDEALEPLPNLDHQIFQGDALHDPMSWGGGEEAFVTVQEAREEVAALRRAYGVAHGEEKAALRGAMLKAQRGVARKVLEGRLQTLREKKAGLVRSAYSPDLFGAVRVRREVQKAIEEAEEGIESLQKKLELVRTEGSLPFSPWMAFSDVMAQGGFDWIITNPPWVRVHKVSPLERSLLKQKYRAVKEGAWTAGGMLSKLKGFGSQVDLSVCFVERALQLLKDRGTFGAILPSRIARSLYGGGARRLLMQEAPPVWVQELPEGVFQDAVTYPMCLVSQKGRPENGSFVSLEFERQTRKIPLWRFRLSAHDLGSPWIFHPGDEEVPGRGKVCLAELEGVQVRRGVMTGLNEAFLNPEEGPRGMVLPVLRGADLSAWRFESSSQILWTHDAEAARPLRTLPPEALAHLEPWQERLQKRGDLRRGHPWWSILRTGPHIYRHKVAWKDIGKTLEAVALRARGPEGEHIIPLNTVYFIPVLGREQALVLAAWMNSSPVRFFAEGLGERARTGYRRFFAWLISLLPVPDAFLSAFSSLQGWRRALQEHPDLAHLLRLSQTYHRNARPLGQEERAVLDAVVERLYR